MDDYSFLNGDLEPDQWALSTAFNMLQANYVWSTRAIQEGDPVYAYLASRGVPPTGRLGYDLRADMRGNMVALIRHPVHGEIVSYQTTFLPGKKRLMAKGIQIPPGSAVRLFPAAAGIGVSTGIETSLSAARIHQVPLWATLTDTSLAKFIPPPGTASLAIFGDRDRNRSGQKAAYRLAERMSAAGIIVTAHFPHAAGDYNDYIRGKIGYMPSDKDDIIRVARERCVVRERALGMESPY